MKSELLVEKTIEWFPLLPRFCDILVSFFCVY